ncbi:MAG: adenosylcobinamide-phosphate synthase CbiB [Chloroflexota bacterium]
MFLAPPAEVLLVLVLALAYDQLFGEPPTPLHPVAWLGNLVALWERFAPKIGPNRQLLYGLLAVLSSIGLVLFGLNYGLEWLRGWSWGATVTIEAFLLKSCFSLRMLGEVGLKMRRLLAGGKLEEARFEMRSLVSRDASKLTDEQITAATIESVTENTTDSFVAPVLFFLFLGVPGALAYRLANTFDSMIGYRGHYEYLGKAGARLDDILNFIPARLTAFLLIQSAPWYKGDRANARKIALRDHRRTSSPNAGWTMAAMAGALHIQLEKVNHYRLGDDEGLIVPGLINRAVAALYIVAAECVVLALLLSGLQWFLQSIS